MGSDLHLDPDPPHSAEPPPCPTSPAPSAESVSPADAEPSPITTAERGPAAPPPAAPVAEPASSPPTSATARPATAPPAGSARSSDAPPSLFPLGQGDGCHANPAKAKSDARGAVSPSKSSPLGSSPTTSSPTTGRDLAPASVGSEPPTSAPRSEPEAKAPSDPPAMAWAKGHGVPAADVEAMVVAALSAVRGKLVSRDRCATDAKEVLGLWKALGRPLPRELAEDLALVAAWAQQSPDRAAARDLRAEGWPEGQDRSRSVATLCRRDRWGDRLAAAQAWAAKGRRSAPPPVAPARTGAAPVRVILEEDGSISNYNPQPRFDPYAYAPASR